MKGEPVDPGRVGAAGEQPHLSFGQPRAEHAQGNERFGRHPTPIRDMGGRCRELQEIKTAPTEQRLGCGHIRQSIEIEVVAIAAVSLESQAQAPRMGPRGNFPDELFSEERGSNGLVVLSNPLGMSNVGRVVERPATSAQKVKHLTVFGFAALSENDWQIRREVVSSLSLEGCEEVTGKGQLTH